MSTYVALLYSIVLPGGRLKNARLLSVAEDCGLDRPRALLATGNLLFETRRTNVAALETQLEAALEVEVGKAISIIARPGAGWEKLVEGNPFKADSKDGDREVAVRVQRDRLDASTLDMLEPYRSEGERIAVVDGDLWMSLPAGRDGARLTNAMTVKRLGIGTTRSWSTVQRIAAALRQGTD